MTTLLWTIYGVVCGFGVAYEGKLICDFFFR